jgi:hypothetical protein
MGTKRLANCMRVDNSKSTFRKRMKDCTLKLECGRLAPECIGMRVDVENLCDSSTHAVVAFHKIAYLKKEEDEEKG